MIQNLRVVMQLTSTDFTALGELFKKRREERQISLKEAEVTTSIKAYYLEAIEEGDFARLISAVYAQGFIKKYAAYLGFDGEQLIRQYPKILQAQPPLPEEEFEYRLATLELRGEKEGEKKRLSIIIWSVLSILVLLLILYLIR